MYARGFGVQRVVPTAITRADYAFTVVAIISRRFKGQCVTIVPTEMVRDVVD